MSASGGRTAQLRYDPLGRLYEVSGSSRTTRFLWDGDDLVAEYDGAGVMKARYIHGTGDDVPLIGFLGDSFTPGIRRYLLADHQGGIIAAAGHDGNSLAQNSYDAWGVPKATNFGRFQYTGQLWIGELGLYHYKARVYDPHVGRFLQVDPIGYDDQVNLYAYVGNDPVNGVDPTGMVEAPLCPGNDPTCTNPAVTAPMTPTERTEHDRIQGRSSEGGSLMELAGSAIAGALYDSLAGIAATDNFDNAMTSAEIGAQGELLVAQELASSNWTVVDSRVAVATAAGMRILDHLASDGQGGFGNIEVKANSSTRDFLQARKEFLIQNHEGVVVSRHGIIPYGTKIFATSIVVTVRQTKR